MLHVKMFLLFRVRRCFYSETSLAGSRVVVTGNEAVSFRKSVGGKKKKAFLSVIKPPQYTVKHTLEQQQFIANGPSDYNI